MNQPDEQEFAEDLTHFLRRRKLNLENLEFAIALETRPPRQQPYPAGGR